MSYVQRMVFELDDLVDQKFFLIQSVFLYAMMGILPFNMFSDKRRYALQLLNLP